jgi:hypothetical protein
VTQRQEVDMEEASVQRKRKSKQAEEAPAAPVEVAPPQLTQRELYELRLAEAEIRCAAKEIEASKFRRLYILALLDPKGRVAAEDKARETAMRNMTESRKRYESVRNLASKRLNLDLSRCSFDADTGVVIPDSARG